MFGACCLGKVHIFSASNDLVLPNHWDGQLARPCVRSTRHQVVNVALRSPGGGNWRAVLINDLLEQKGFLRFRVNQA